MLKSGFNILTLERFYRAKEKFKAKISGTFIERIAKYLGNVATDYKEVAVSVRTDIKEKPIKAAFFFTGLGFLTCSVMTNPNEQSFRAKFIEYANNAALVHPNMANPHATAHLNHIQRCYNREVIRHTSFGFFTIIWVDNYSDQSGIYETNCPYLQVPYRKVASRVIDVGFLNVWWVLSRKMLDYDINY